MIHDTDYTREPKTEAEQKEMRDWVQSIMEKVLGAPLPREVAVFVDPNAGASGNECYCTAARSGRSSTSGTPSAAPYDVPARHLAPEARRAAPWRAFAVHSDVHGAWARRSVAGATRATCRPSRGF